MSAGRVAVLAVTHRAPELVRMLADDVLDGDRAVLVVHHDPQGPELELPDTARVRRVPNPRHIRWGREDLALAILDSLQFCQDSIPDLEWVLVVSGQDQLCRPMVEIEKELASTPYDACVRWLHVTGVPPDEPEHQWQAQCRTRYLRRIRAPWTHHSVPFARRSPFRFGTELYIGDAWVNLSSSALAHVLDQRRRLREVERFLVRCAATDEALLPTLLLNDIGELRVQCSTRRYMEWTPRTPHPRTLGEQQIPAIIRSDAFFARKFDDYSSALALARART